MTTTDFESRQKIRTALDTSLLVEAAAGTGKTHELVERAVALLASGRAQAESLVMVTFTKKAAGELELRLREALDRARDQAKGEDRARLEHALAHLEEAHISTIHGFCADLLREHPVEAGIDPEFVELDEDEGARLFRRTFRRWLEEQLLDLPRPLERALYRARPGWGETQDNLTTQLALEAQKLLERRDQDAQWDREPFDLEAELSPLVVEARRLAALSRLGDPADALYQATGPLRALEDFLGRASPGTAELEERILRLRELKLPKKAYGKYSEATSQLAFTQAVQSLVDQTKLFGQRADADLAASLQAALRPVIDTYQEEKRRAGRLDFVDLLVEVRKLLVLQPLVRQQLSQRYSHIFVDEFQDTDLVQVEILFLLASADPQVLDWRSAAPVPGKLFLVGDPKQSIYRFRRADTLIYLEVKRILQTQGVQVVTLSHSFRATQNLQEAVNTAFGGHLVEDASTGQAGYVPLSGGPAAPSTQPSLVALASPKFYGKGTLNRAYAHVAVGFAAWLLQSGWTVREGEQRVPIEPRHIALLLRRTKGEVLAPYLEALEDFGLPHQLGNGRLLRGRPEIEAMVTLLTALEWPDDELAVYATLHGPFYGLTDADLFSYRQAEGRLHPWRKGRQPSLAQVDQALDQLQQLSARRNERALVETLSELWRLTRGLTTLALRPNGQLALDAIERVSELARRFEKRGGISFRSFVEFLEDEAQRGKSPGESAPSEGGDGIFVTTVHGAKGLEFPVVILADPDAPFSYARPDRYLDPARNKAVTTVFKLTPWELLAHADQEQGREKAEAVRLAYVAATRARDLLVVPGLAEGRNPSYPHWLLPLDPLLYPKRPWVAQPAPGLPWPLLDSLVDEQPQRSGAAPPRLLPGQYQAAAGPVTWMDLALLPQPTPTDHRGPLGFINKNAPREAAEGSIAAYTEWKAAREATLSAGAIASIVPVRPSEAQGSPPRAKNVPSFELPRRPGRPSGQRFGTLVHAILAEVPLSAASSEVSALAKMQGLILSATEAEVVAATETVRGLLAHPVITRAKNASRVYREYPLVWPTETGEVLDGVADLVFLEPGQWVVVDWKTDADGPRESHQRQVQWYAEALKQGTQTPAVAFLVYL